jgi:hypothetical protein
MPHWDYHHAVLGSSPANAQFPWDQHHTSALLMIPDLLLTSLCFSHLTKD